MGLVGHSGMLIHSAIRATTLQTLTTNQFTKKGIHSKSPLQNDHLKLKTFMEFRCTFFLSGCLACSAKNTQVSLSERRAEAPGALRAEIMLSYIQGFFRLNVPGPLASSEIYPRVKILLWSQEIKQWNRLPLLH